MCFQTKKPFTCRAVYIIIRAARRPLQTASHRLHNLEWRTTNNHLALLSINQTAEHSDHGPTPPVSDSTATCAWHANNHPDSWLSSAPPHLISISKIDSAKHTDRQHSDHECMTGMQDRRWYEHCYYYCRFLFNGPPDITPSYAWHPEGL